jgi:hypothetical protein
VQVELQDVYRVGSTPLDFGYGEDGRRDIVVVNRSEALLLDKAGLGDLALLTPSYSPCWALILPIVSGATSSGVTVAVPHVKALRKHGARCIAMGEFALELEVPGSATARRDFFIGTGSAINGMVSELARAQNSFEPFDTVHDRLPGNQRDYGSDYALDSNRSYHFGLQMSRAYQFLYQDVGKPGASPQHWHLTAPSSPKVLEYRRGRSTPGIGEDGVFADFDGDGDLDILAVGEAFPSASHPLKGSEASAFTTVAFIWNVVGGHWPVFDHAHTLLNLLTDHMPPADMLTDSLLGPGTGGQRLVDSSIDLGTRVRAPYPLNADRAVAGDLDNDGDIDAIVQLFGIGTVIHETLDSHFTYMPSSDWFTTAPGGPADPADFCFGWQLLMNDGAPQPTFHDKGGRNLRTVGGGFSKYWNRTLGMTFLADLDNNGALDIYSGQGGSGCLSDGTPAAPSSQLGFAKSLTVEHVDQLRDIVFLNGVDGDPVGVFREKGAQLLPQQGLWPDVAKPVDDVSEPATTAGTSHLAYGDIDNDGDSDVLVFRGVVGQQVPNYPGLLVNDLGGPSGVFADEFLTRVSVGDLDELIQTPPITSQSSVLSVYLGMDAATAGGIFDVDGDGDNDIVYFVAYDYPRVLLNKGQDLDGNGVINARDNSELGEFEDATEEIVQPWKRVFPATDTTVIDIDHDGDLDILADTWDDIPHFWLNSHAGPTSGPYVTEAWPRIGRTRGGAVDLHGVGLDGADMVELRFATGAPLLIDSTGLTNVSNHVEYDRLRVTIPANAPLGLAQVRVRVNGVWSKQYFGYFVLGA